MGLRWAIMLSDSVSVHDSVCVCVPSLVCEVCEERERWPRGRRGWLKNKLISRLDRWETGGQISREIKMLIAARRRPPLSRWPALINFYVVIISSPSCGLSLAGKEVISSPQLTNYTERVNWLLMWKQEALWGWGWRSSLMSEYFLFLLFVLGKIHHHRLPFCYTLWL